MPCLADRGIGGDVGGFCTLPEVIMDVYLWEIMKLEFTT